MIFTSDRELSCVAGAAVLPPHAVRTSTAVRTNNNGRLNMRIRLLLNLDFAADCGWAPSDQAVLTGGDDCFRQQRHGCQQHHPRENSVDVEVVLGAVDQLLDSLARAKELPDHGTYQR